MKLIPESFTKNGFSHRLCFRAGKVAIFKRWKGTQPPHFETIIIREQKPRKLQTPSGTIDLPHAELYPGSELWGTYGWTHATFEEAKAKAETLAQ